MSTAAITFRATLEQAGKTATGIVVPPDVVERLGGGGRPAVRATIAGHTYRSTLGVRGGEHKLPVSAENRAQAGVEAGDELDVTLALDTEPRDVELPADFAQALDAHPDARRFYDGLSPSKRKAFVTVIDDAKTPETRQRRVSKAVEKLREGRDR